MQQKQATKLVQLDPIQLSLKPRYLGSGLKQHSCWEHFKVTPFRFLSYFWFHINLLHSKEHVHWIIKAQTAY